MEQKNNLDGCCSDELEEMIIDNIKAVFLSNHEILDECREYIKEDYPNDFENITDDEFLEIIQTIHNKFQNTGHQENFLKLDLAFNN